MAKRVKTKKGSIGKKALAAILAASMVLSSSAFSVLAAGGVEEVMPTALEDASINYVIVQVADQPWGGVGESEKEISPQDIRVRVHGAEAGPGIMREIGVWDETNPSKDWTYELLSVEGPTTLGSQAGIGKSTATNEKAVEKDDMEKHFNSPCTDSNSANRPHIHIKLHKGTAPVETNDWFDGKVLGVDYLIVPANISTDGGNTKTDAKWSNPKTFTYDGTFQRPTLQSVTIDPRKNGEGFDLPVENFDENVSSANYNLAGEYTVSATTKNKDADNQSLTDKYTGSTDSVKFTVEKARLDAPGLVAVKVNPVTLQDNDRDLIAQIAKKTSVRDIVKMDQEDGKVVGEELQYKKDWDIIFPDANENYTWKNNAWVQNVPENEVGKDKPMRIVALDNCRNFAEYYDTTYEVRPKNDLEQIVKNIEIKGFTDDDNDGVWEKEYNATDQFPKKSNGNMDIVLKDGTKTLVEGTDYRIQGNKSWINAGVYTMTIVGINSYAGGSATFDVEIERKPLWKVNKNATIDANIYKVTVVQSKLGDNTYGDVFAEIEWNNNLNTDEGDGNKDGAVHLQEGRDFEVSPSGIDYSNDGMYKVLDITGKGNYTSEWTNKGTTGSTVQVGNETDSSKNLTVIQEDTCTDLRDSSITVTIRPISYSEIGGKEYKLKDSDIEVIDTRSQSPDLKLDKDYVIVGGNTLTNLHTGSNTISIQGTGQPQSGTGRSYCAVHSRTVTLMVVGDSFKAAYEADDIADIPYKGPQSIGGPVQAIDLPQPAVHEIGTGNAYRQVRYEYYDQYGNPMYENGTDDTEGYKITDKGEYTVRIYSTEARFERESYIEKTFRVVGEDITKAADITVTADSVVYDGSIKKPAVTVTLKGTTAQLTENIDYEIDSTAVNAGAAKATLRGIGEYGGSMEIDFTIIPASIEGATVTAENQEYSDNPVVTVKVGDTTLTQGTDYTVSCTKSEDGKTATVTVTGTGNYTGTAAQTATFEIVEGGSDEPEPTPPVEETIKTPTITLSRKISKTKKTFTVTTCKVPGATEWEVQYSLKKARKADNSLKSNKSRIYASNKADRLYRKVINCNKSGKVYYVRVRAKVNGNWSEWSDTAEPLEHIKSR